MAKRYILFSHVDYENLIAPKGHKYEGKRLIDIILKEDKVDCDNYYKERYKGFSMLERSIYTADYSKLFYEKRDVLPIGDNSIYL